MRGSKGTPPVDVPSTEYAPDSRGACPTPVRARTRLAMLRVLGLFLNGVSRANPKITLQTSNPRILVIRPDHLGDALLAAPAGRMLRAALPEARIDWLVGPWAAEVVGRAADPDETLTCEFPGFARRPKRSPWEPYAELSRQARRLRRRDYDLALVLRSDHWWGALLAATSGIPRRLGFDVPACRPFLTHMLPLDDGLHSVEQGLALARLATSLHVPRTMVMTPEPSFPLETADRAWVDQRLSSRDGGPLIAIHPGSGSAVKNWSAERWRQVAMRLRRESKAALVLTGGGAEAEMLLQIAETLEPRPTILAGETSLGQLAALFERCTLVLGGDSGPLHLAAAVGTATVRIYGPTATARFGPRGDPARQRIVQLGLPCQPCGNIVAPPCGAIRAPACLRLVTVDRVVDEALALLAADRSPLRSC